MICLSAVLIVLCVSPVLFGSCSNILVILSFPAPSHHTWNVKIVNKLAEQGHNLTVLSAVKPETAPKNVHYIHLERLMDTIWSKADFKQEDVVMASHYRLIKILYDHMLLVCEGGLRSDGFQALQNYPDDFQFNMVIHDLNAGPCLLGLLQKFGYPPLVGISPFKYSSELADIMGGHMYPAYIPVPCMPFSAHMNFLQRMENMYYTILDHIYKDYIHIPARDKLANTFYKTPFPSFLDLERRMTVALLNIHPSTDFAIPLPPNVITVGGLEIEQPKPLPPDLDNFTSSGKKGTILICFGTYVDTLMFPDEKQHIVIEVIKQFPEFNFLWKFEKDLSNGSVPNLMVKKWLPQNDILAHPNVKLFVSHGGGLSTHEATWHGVPLVVVPFFLDQIRNSQRSVDDGVAVLVDVETMTVRKLEEALHSILQRKDYLDRMKLRSMRFRERPMSPMDLAVWWIEYVMRNPDPVHLRSPALHLGIWSSNSYDVMTCFMLVIITFVVGMYFLFRKICRMSSSEKQKIL